MPDVDYTTIRTGLQYLNSLSREAREALVSAFEAAEPAIALDRLVLTVGARSQQPTHKVRDLAYTVSHMFSLLEEGSVEPKNLARAFAEWGAGTEQGAEELAGYLVRLLACERSIGVAGKAQSIMWGQGNVYQKARVITQVRPVFFRNPALPPQNAVIIHELTVECRSGDERRTLSVVLDDRQLRALLSVVNRALEKDNTLRTHTEPVQYLHSEDL